jgi:hypothetical protein
VQIVFFSLQRRSSKPLNGWIFIKHPCRYTSESCHLRGDLCYKLLHWYAKCALSLAHKCMYAIILISDHRKRIKKKKYAIIIFLYIRQRALIVWEKKLSLIFFFNKLQFMRVDIWIELNECNVKNELEKI